MIILILIFLGLSFGSFVNALVYRLYQKDKNTYRNFNISKTHKKITNVRTNKNLSILNGRSICVHCKHQLSSIDLIPVISWLSLKGRCRYCQTPISWQYPLVELITAILFVFSYLYWPQQFNVYQSVIFGFWLVYLVGFMALIVYDLRYTILPNKIVFSLIGVYAVQLLYMLIYGNLGLLSLISILIGGVILSGLFWLIFQVSSGAWIGGGDVKLSILLGALAGGAIEAFLLLFIASFLGSVIGGTYLIAAKRFKLKAQLPFGPYLMIATIIVVLFGTPLIDWYKNFITLR